MLAGAHEARSGDSRDVARTNLFLAAVLHSSGFASTPVKVRNLSASGAMIEGAALPPHGSTVRLVRGRLSIAGSVVWVAGNRVGLAFHGSISVKDWMAPPTNGEQQRVDNTVAQLRAGLPALPVAMPEAAPVTVIAELELVTRLVEQLGDALAADPLVLARHGLQLQKIDIAVQLVEATARVLHGKPGSGARLIDLRASAEQALRSGAN